MNEIDELRSVVRDLKTKVTDSEEKLQIIQDHLGVDLDFEVEMNKKKRKKSVAKTKDTTVTGV